MTSRGNARAASPGREGRTYAQALDAALQERALARERERWWSSAFFSSDLPHLPHTAPEGLDATHQAKLSDKVQPDELWDTLYADTALAHEATAARPVSALEMLREKASIREWEVRRSLGVRGGGAQTFVGVCLSIDRSIYL